MLFSISVLHAQQTVNPIPEEVQVGDVLEVGKPETNRYKYIDFPRENFIIKKGGVANYKRAEGKKVVVTSISEKKDGTKQIKIKREDGGRFFGSHTTIKADLKDALNSGELLAR